MATYVVSEDTIFANQLITSAHFGVNLVTIYDEEFVDPNHELSSNVAQLGATTLRFPGGSATENFFDMTAPNRAYSLRDPSQTLTPMDLFFAEAGEIGVAVTIVIPTQMAFSQSAAEAMLSGTYGSRGEVTATYLQDVATFVATAVAYAEINGVEISAFEIGNEFWGSGQMTAREYGIVAGEVAALLAEELPALGVTGSEIIVQTTSAASQLYSSRDPVNAYVGTVDGVAQAFTQQDIDRDYGGVVPEGWQAVVVPGQGGARPQVTQIAEGINSVPGAADAIDGIVQHYYQSGGFAEADGTRSFKFSQFQRLEDLLNRSPDSAEMTYHISEWNTNATGSLNNRGLQNASMMIENFFELVANDVDAAQIWPLSFDSAQGISLVDLDGPDLAISGEMFRLMAESLPGSTPLFDWSVEGVIDIHGFAKSDGAVFFVSERSGLQQAEVTLDLSQFLTGHSYFMTSTQLWDGGAGGDNAAAAPELSDVDGVLSNAVVIGLDLDAWANRRIEVTYVGEGDDAVNGRGGADVIETFGGSDTVYAGAGNDTVSGGEGDDRLFGEDGDDVLSGGAGSDVIDGGDGFDRVEFEGVLTGYSVRFDMQSMTDGVLRVAGPGGDEDLLRAVEALSFADQEIAVDRVLAYLQNTYGPEFAGEHQLALQQIAAAPDPTLPPQRQMEVGRTSIQQPDSNYWQSVTFSEAISDAAVIMGPASAEGKHPFTVRVRNVTETGFEFQIDEWDYLDGWHMEVQISWMAGSIGTHDLLDGTRISFGSVGTTSLQRTAVSFEGFDSTPVIMGQLAGDAEAASIAHRIDDVTADGFDFQVQLEEASAPLRSSIADSVFYYAALDFGADSFLFQSGTQSINHKYTGIGEYLDPGEALFANMQTINGKDPGVVRYFEDVEGGISLKIDEERSKDQEKHHAHEDIAWFFIDEGIYDFL